MRKTVGFAVVIGVLTYPLSSWCQETIMHPVEFPHFYAGAEAGVALTFHRGTYVAYDNATECGSFTTGNGMRGTFGLRLEFPLSRRLSLVTSLLYDDRSGKFTQANPVYPILGPTNTVEDVTLEQNLEVTLRYLAVAPMLKVRLLDFGLGIVVGPSVGLLTSNSFTEKESIVSPIYVTYLDNTQTKTITSGDIKTKNSFFVDAKGGIEFEVEIEKKITLMPEVLASYSLTKVASDPDWRILRLEFLVGVRLWI